MIRANLRELPLIDGYNEIHEMRFVPRIGDKIALSAESGPQEVVDVIWMLDEAEFDVQIRFAKGSD